MMKTEKKDILSVLLRMVKITDEDNPFLAVGNVAPDQGGALLSGDAELMIVRLSIAMQQGKEIEDVVRGAVLLFDIVENFTPPYEDCEKKGECDIFAKLEAVDKGCNATKDLINKYNREGGN